MSLLKPLAPPLLALLLGACAAPNYSPVVDELSVPARPSGQPLAGSAKTVNNNPVIPLSSLVVVTTKVKPYTAPKAAGIITGQFIASELVTLPAESGVQGAPLPKSGQPVVEKLLAKADQLKVQGKVTEAGMQLQRAQRIAPREPKIYARLAALELSLGKASLAEQLALKGLTLVPNKNNYQYYFWKLISTSRRHLGDSKGEAKAMSQAEKYR